MAANKQSSLVLRVQDAANATGATTINVGAFAADGCTIHGIIMETQATAGGSGTITITGGGNSLINTAAPANQDQAARTTGTTVFQLTATEAHLSLAPSADIVITRATANSQNDITFYYGDKSPIAVVTS